MGCSSSKYPSMLIYSFIVMFHHPCFWGLVFSIVGSLICIVMRVLTCFNNLHRIAGQWIWMALGHENRFIDHWGHPWKIRMEQVPKLRIQLVMTVVTLLPQGNYGYGWFSLIALWPYFKVAPSRNQSFFVCRWWLRIEGSVGSFFASHLGLWETIVNMCITSLGITHV